MYHHLLDKIKQEQPDWKGALVKNTLLFVCLLLEEKTVNLWKLKGSVGKVLGNTKTDCRSHYQRLKRWLRTSEKDKGLWVGLLKASVSLLTKKSKCLIIDGTSWQWGGKTYHFLTLSILYQGVSVPIFWLELSRLGISNQWHRKLLLRLSLKLFDLRGKILLADREYIGQDWFMALQKASIGFVIRLRAGNYQKQIEQGGKPIAKLEQKAKARLGRVVWQVFQWEKKTYTFVLLAYRSRAGKVELLRLITTLTPQKAIEYYQYRYRIEPMFRHLKSNGFDLESLYVKKAYKLQLIMAGLVLAYTLAIVYGLQKFKQTVKLKKHGSPQMSVFRWGLDLWQNHLSSFVLFLEQLASFFRLWRMSAKHALIHNVP